MSRSQVSLDALARTRRTVAEIQSTDVHGAVLTLTRTSDQAITTAGAFVVWQQIIRGYQIAWAGTAINIPAAGWYCMQLTLRFSVNLNNCFIVPYRNGVVPNRYNLLGDTDLDAAAVTMMQYYAAGDTVQFAVFPSANCNIVRAAEGSAFESPILHIAQLSGGVNA